MISKKTDLPPLCADCIHIRHEGDDHWPASWSSSDRAWCRRIQEFISDARYACWMFEHSDRRADCCGHCKHWNGQTHITGICTNKASHNLYDTRNRHEVCAFFEESDHKPEKVLLKLCSTCKAFHKLTDHTAETPLGRCRRLPPTKEGWPQVKGYHWCLKWTQEWW